MKSSATNQAKQDIAQASSEAVRTIAKAAEEAAKVIANNAATAAKVVDVKGAGDHDTLITLVSAVANIDSKFTDKFAELKIDIKSINDGTVAELGDHEGRLRKLEQQRWLWAGGLMVAVFLAPIIFNWVASIINKAA